MPSLPIGSYSPVLFSMRDQWNKIGVQKFFAKPLTAANYTAQQALAASYRDAVIAVCLGQLASWVYGEDNLVSAAIPTNGALRKVKLVIGYWDTTTFQKFQTTIPTINDDLTVAIPNTPDIVEADTPTEISTLISTFSAFAVPYNQPTHTVQVYRLAIQGRSH
jgi:hypothetical protein